jgi:hypothetical protein
MLFVMGCIRWFLLLLTNSVLRCIRVTIDALCAAFYSLVSVVVKCFRMNVK